MTAAQISTAQMRELANTYQFAAVNMFPIKAHDALISAADQLDQQAARVRSLEAALERELDGCRRICAGSVAALNAPDMQRHFHRQLDRLKAALAQTASGV